MRRIGSSNLSIFPLGLGGNTLGTTTDEAASERILDAFVDGGGNHVDTADVYSHWAPGGKGGESETVLGAWMRRRGNRARVVVGTKVGAMPGLKGLTAEIVGRAVEGSLQRLQTDYIDLYYVHYDQPDLPIEDIAGTFDRLVRDGKVRHVAASNMAPERIEAWIRVAERDGLAAPVALQPEYNLVARQGYEQRYAPLAEAHHLGVLPYFSLASGFLTGKYRGEADLAGHRRGSAVARYLTDDGLGVLRAIGAVAAAHGAAPATVALAWLLSRPNVVAPLASATSTDQLAQLLAAPRLRLTPDELAALDRASAPFA